MAGHSTDTTIITITVPLPAGHLVEVQGYNDGVNGFTWQATLDGQIVPFILNEQTDIDLAVAGWLAVEEHAQQEGWDEEDEEPDGPQCPERQGAYQCVYRSGHSPEFAHRFEDHK